MSELRNGIYVTGGYDGGGSGNISTIFVGDKELEAIEGVVHIDGSTGENQSLKTINGNVITGTGDIAIRTFSSFPAAVLPYTNSSIETFMQHWTSLNLPSGTAYLGGVSFSSGMPKTMQGGNSELIIYIPVSGVFLLEMSTTDSFESLGGGVAGKWWSMWHGSSKSMDWKGLMGCPQDSAGHYIPIQNSDGVSKFYFDFKIGNNSELTTTDKTTIVAAINEVDALAKGGQTAQSFENYQSLITTVNAADASAYKVGQNFYIKTIDVPDVWIYAIDSTSVPYVYTTDAAFIESLKTQDGAKVGYYRFSLLETAKVDLTNYRTKQQQDAIDASINANISALDSITEKIANRVETINSSSLNTQYPGAKAVYDFVSTNVTSMTTAEIEATCDAAWS